MEQVTIIGVDLAKNVFQVHGASDDGSVAFRKKLTRPQFKRFMREVDPCFPTSHTTRHRAHFANFRGGADRRDGF